MGCCMSDADRDLAYPYCAWPRRDVGVRRWCIVQTEYRREATAADEIKGLGYFVYFPKMRLEQYDPNNTRKRRDVIRPLIPGYVFAKVGADLVPWRVLAKRRGVRDLLRQNGEPVRVPDDVIDELRDAERDRLKAQPVPAPHAFRAGQGIVLCDGGPWSGLYGLIASVDAADRITVLIEAFGRHVPVRGLNPDQIEPT